MEKPLITHRELVDLVKFDRATGHFYWRRGARGRKGVYEPLGTKRDSGYVTITLKGRSYLAHRLAWCWEFSDFPPFRIEHKNGKRDDNRIKNLRLTNIPIDENGRINHAEGRRKVSMYKGVYWHKANQKWAAKITSQGEVHHLGTFSNEECARDAYIDAANRLRSGRPMPTNNKDPRYRGVTWEASRNKWRATLRIGGKIKNVGRFDSREEAKAAIDQAARAAR